MRHFLPETAVAIFDPEHDDTKDEASPVYDQLYTLWRRGLLTREAVTVARGNNSVLPRTPDDTSLYREIPSTAR